MSDTARNKEAVSRFVEDVMNGGRLEVIDELCTPDLAPGAKHWIEPFRESFPDVRMEVVELIAEGDKVAARFLCSATQRGEWRGRAASGRRFENVDEVYFFRFRDGRIAEAWGLEDTAERLRQLGLEPS
jgi:predicted ester cyclase